MNKGVLRYLRTQVKDMLVKRLMIDMHCPRGKAKALAKRFVRSESVPALKNALQTKCRPVIGEPLVFIVEAARNLASCPSFTY